MGRPLRANEHGGPLLGAPGSQPALPWTGPTEPGIGGIIVETEVTGQRSSKGPSLAVNLVINGEKRLPAG